MEPTTFVHEIRPPMAGQFDAATTKVARKHQTTRRTKFTGRARQGRQGRARNTYTRTSQGQMNLLPRPLRQPKTVSGQRRSVVRVAWHALHTCIRYMYICMGERFHDRCKGKAWLASEELLEKLLVTVSQQGHCLRRP